ncbi:hypothetical protein B0H14DRAFT_3535988 [Mycena olivaceomarginata]|nr:hypothetical protein B0H14DRAFT_3535988 [Mycena olivaceomarginata]
MSDFLGVYGLSKKRHLFLTLGGYTPSSPSLHPPRPYNNRTQSVKCLLDGLTWTLRKDKSFEQQAAEDMKKKTKNGAGRQPNTHAGGARAKMAAADTTPDAKIVERVAAHSENYRGRQDAAERERRRAARRCTTHPAYKVRGQQFFFD